MRIAIFTDSYKPYVSGVTVAVETLKNELRALGHRVYISAPNYTGAQEEKDVVRFPSIPTSYPGFRLAIPYLRDFPEVDIVHAHSPFQTGLLARYLARKRSIPFVYTFHTLFTRYTHYAGFLPQRLSKLAIAIYIREFCRRANLIIAPSEMSKRVLRKWGIYQQCKVVPTGIQFWKPRRSAAVSPIKGQLGVPDDAKVLVYLGRISEEKNIPFLLEAFNTMWKENLFLLMIGGGPLLEDLKKRNLRNVIFTGGLPHEEALQSCSTGDIFVFASTTETQGLVLAEAKSLELPIVALFAGGLVDTVRSGIDGYLVPRNIDAFVSHAKRLLDDEPLRQKMGEAARQDALERFSSGKIAKQIETLYNSLIQSKEGHQNVK